MSFTALHVLAARSYINDQPDGDKIIEVSLDCPWRLFIVTPSVTAVIYDKADGYPNGPYGDEKYEVNLKHGGELDYRYIKFVVSDDGTMENWLFTMNFNEALKVAVDRALEHTPAQNAPGASCGGEK